jgi:hypothetical protein
MAAGDVTAQLSSQAIRTGTFNDGTVSGGVTIEDGAIVLDGSSGTIITTTGTENIIDDTFSLALWLDFNTQAQFAGVITKGTVNVAGWELIATNFARVLDFSGIHAGTNTQIFRTAPLPAGMNLYILTFNGTTATLYLNNVFNIQGDKNVDNIIDSNELLRLGGRAHNTDRAFNGISPNMQIYNKVLSESERTAIYNAGKDAYSPVTDGLVAQYSGRDFAGTEASPDIIYDTATFNRSMERTIERQLTNVRTGANDIYFMDEVNKSILNVHIEEA